MTQGSASLPDPRHPVSLGSHARHPCWRSCLPDRTCDRWR